MKEMLLITFLLVCVLEGAFALDCPADDISMSKEDDNNFYVKYPKVDTFDLCGTFCARSDRCKFWTWYSMISATKKYDELDCLLFESDDQLNTINGAKSGKKLCPTTIYPEPECKACSPEPIRFAAKELDDISFDDGQDANYLDKVPGVGESSLCGKLCAITTPCIYWTWYKRTDGKRNIYDCLMFDNIIQLRHNENAISGEKHNPITNPEATCAPCNAGNSVQLMEKGVITVFGMAFYVAVMAAIKM